MNFSKDLTGSVINEVAIVIASTGRREVLEATLLSLMNRESVPGALVVVGASADDLPCSAMFPDNWQFLVSPRKGLTLQRNYGVANLGTEASFIVFLDDDMEVADDFAIEVANVFQTRKDIAAFSGCILVNGGITRTEARQRLDSYSLPKGMPPFGELRNGWPGLYGCSMCVRREIVIAEPFDERLPLYALGEDIDAGFRFRRHGLIGGSARCVVAHLAVRTGRLSEYRVGYSQIANVVYFWRKRIGYSLLDLLRQVGWTFVANLCYSLFPRFDRRGDVDRRGRMKGNIKGLFDWLCGRLSPERILELK